MSEFCLRNVTVRRQKTAEKQVISGDSTIQCGREFPGQSEKRFPFQKNLRIIQEQYCFLFITIMLLLKKKSPILYDYHRWEQEIKMYFEYWEQTHYPGNR